MWNYERGEITSWGVKTGIKSTPAASREFLAGQNPKIKTTDSTVMPKRKRKRPDVRSVVLAGSSTKKVRERHPKKCGGQR
jgi:hypothetical protein